MLFRSRAARAAGARKAGLVSAMGAAPHSRIFYSRVKGELEDALSQLSFDGWVIARPSLLVGDRGALGQPVRMGEQLGFSVGRALGFLIPENYRPIEAGRVARALLRMVPTAQGAQVLLANSMRD